MESYLNGISPAALFTVVFSIVFLAILLLLLCLLVHRRIWRIGLLIGTFILVAFAATFYSAVQLQLERRAAAAREQVYQKVEQLQKETQKPPVVPAASTLEEKSKDEVTDGSYAERREKEQRSMERHSFGRRLGGIEKDLHGQTASYNDKIATINAQYRNGEMDSYEELTLKAHLEIDKQEAILKAMDEKLELLNQSRFLTAADKEKDIAAIEERKQQAQKTRDEYRDVLQQVEENKDVFHSL